MLLRDALGETLRDARTRQNRTLRDVSTAANVSLGYLSEVERGRKEASSELLASICDALDLELSQVLDTVSEHLRTRPAAAAAKAVTGNSTKVGVVTNAAGNTITNPVANIRPKAGVAPAPRVIDPSLRIVLPYPNRAASIG